MGRKIYCKPKHRALTNSTPGERRGPGDLRSRCPGWASQVDQALLDKALVDTDAGLDVHGHPRRLWNAVNGEVFVGVSANLKEATYNCYPEVPTALPLREQLEARRRRTLDDVRHGHAS